MIAQVYTEIGNAAWAVYENIADGLVELSWDVSVKISEEIQISKSDVETLKKWLKKADSYFLAAVRWYRQLSKASWEGRTLDCEQAKLACEVGQCFLGEIPCQ